MHRAAPDRNASKKTQLSQQQETETQAAAQDLLALSGMQPQAKADTDADVLSTANAVEQDGGHEQENE